MSNLNSRDEKLAQRIAENIVNEQERNSKQKAHDESLKRLNAKLPAGSEEQSIFWGILGFVILIVLAYAVYSFFAEQWNIFESQHPSISDRIQR